MMRPRRAREWRLGPALAVALSLAAGCSAPPGPPDVVLISLDTLRADTAAAHMPNLRAFGESGRWVDEVYAPVAFTLSAHVSMLFGIGVEEHRVFVESDRIPPDVEGLAEVFSGHGYRTAALVTNEWLKADFGFGRGFDDYQLLPHAATYADRVIPEVLGALEARAADPRPVFVFAHFMDPHSDFEGQGTGVMPYFAPPDLIEDLDLSTAADLFCLGPGECASLWLMAFQRRIGFTPRPGALELARTLYERGVRGLDRDLTVLWRTLERRGLDRTIVLVTSDHGEEFLEHGRTVHSQPYEESLLVPFVLRADGRSLDLTAPPPYSLADVPSTLAGLAGIRPSASWSGRDLTTSMEHRTLVARDKLYDRWALRSRRWTALQPLPETGRPAELFDRRADRSERHNLAASEPEVMAGQLAAVTRALSIRSPAQHPSSDSALTAEERARLDALGYAR